MTTASAALIRHARAHEVPFDALGWPGKRYRVLEQAGEPMDILFKRYRMGGAVVDEELVRHEVHDGVGAFTAILESRGFTVPSMPALRHPSRPSRLRRLLLLLRYIGEVRGWPSTFREEPAWEVKGAWPAVAVALFDRARTTAFAQALARQGASTTSGILASLDRHAAARFLTQESPRRWMVPVNMRTSPTEKIYENRVTSVLLPFPEAQQPAAVHASLKHMLSSDYHWGTQLFIDVAKRFREERVRRMSARFDPRRTVFGFVTNVGAWPPAGAAAPRGDEDADSPDDDAAWCMMPPVGRRGPVACGMLTWRGKLVVTLKVHGCLKQSAADVRAVLDDVAADVAAAAGGAGAGAVFSDDTTARA